jgi:hypothetical protein
MTCREYPTGGSWRKARDGCIWTYQAMTSTIMPETFHVLPYASQLSCPSNQTPLEGEVLQKADEEAVGEV